MSASLLAPRAAARITFAWLDEHGRTIWDGRVLQANAGALSAAGTAVVDRRPSSVVLEPIAAAGFDPDAAEWTVPFSLVGEIGTMIQAHGADREVGGFLVGRGQHVDAALQAFKDSTETSVCLTAESLADRFVAEAVGCWHSHPAGSTLDPSQTDRDAAVREACAAGSPWLTMIALADVGDWSPSLRAYVAFPDGAFVRARLNFDYDR